MEYLIVTLRSYYGVDTSMEVDPCPLYMVVDSHSGKELDNGYTELEEVLRCWPYPQNLEYL